MKRQLFLILLFTMCSFFVSAHSGKARFHILIDTDGAADDLRALCMLLGNREVEILSVTTSEGALTPTQAAVKVKALLHLFHHEGIPVAAGRSLNVAAPDWRNQSDQIDWGNETGIEVPEQPASELITYTIENEDEKVVMICLGTLTNLHDALAAKPQLKERIDRVIWYNSAAKPLSGPNYDTDKESADKVLASGVPVEIVSAEGKQGFKIDKRYVAKIAGIDNVYTKKIVETHRIGVLAPVVASGHMQSWDDMAVVWLYTPELFTVAPVTESVTFCSLTSHRDVKKALDAACAVLTGKPDSENRVFYAFPEDPALYAADIAPVMKDIIARHGHSEWRAGVLTNELHGHLGIYAIIGVKMGLRVREYFNIGVDDIAIVTYAGLQPPVSCMNDGLQVSTGGTLGHGLIMQAINESIRPEAMFKFKEKAIRLKLKPEYAAQIRNDVSEGIRLYGNLTEPYWLHIRALAIKYWQEFDRHEIFELTTGADF